MIGKMSQLKTDICSWIVDNILIHCDWFDDMIEYNMFEDKIVKIWCDEHDKSNEDDLISYLGHYIGVGGCNFKDEIRRIRFEHIYDKISYNMKPNMTKNEFVYKCLNL